MLVIIQRPRGNHLVVYPLHMQRKTVLKQSTLSHRSHWSPCKTLMSAADLASGCHKIAPGPISQEGRWVRLCSLWHGGMALDGSQSHSMWQSTAFWWNCDPKWSVTWFNNSPKRHHYLPKTILYLSVWIIYFLWNFKGYLWNSTQNILPIHSKIQLL